MGRYLQFEKHLYRDLSGDDINDLVMPLGVVRSGFRGVLENRAVCSEGMSSNFNDEYRRQIRIATRTIRAIWKNIDLLNPVKYGLFAVQFFSHKVLKVLVPLFLITSLFLSGVLAFQQRTFAIFFWIQIALYVVGITVRSVSTSWICRSTDRHSKNFCSLQCRDRCRLVEFLSGKEVSPSGQQHARRLYRREAKRRFR